MLKLTKQIATCFHFCFIVLSLIDGQGLEPDIAVTVPDNLPADQDPFVEAALAYFDQMGINTKE